MSKLISPLDCPSLKHHKDSNHKVVYAIYYNESKRNLLMIYHQQGRYISDLHIQYLETYNGEDEYCELLFALKKLSNMFVTPCCLVSDE